MDNLSHLPPGLKNSTHTSEDFALPSSFTATLVVSKYFENEFQRIFKMVPESQTLAVGIPLLESRGERSSKTRFPNVYQGKTHIKCYNFYQQCENHFAIAGAKSLNQIYFAMSFFLDQALIY